MVCALTVGRNEVDDEEKYTSEKLALLGVEKIRYTTNHAQ